MVIMVHERSSQRVNSNEIFMISLFLKNYLIFQNLIQLYDFVLVNCFKD